MYTEKSLDVIDYEGKNQGWNMEKYSKFKIPYFTVERINILLMKIE